jgi:hypothetical protein
VTRSALASVRPSVTWRLFTQDIANSLIEVRHSGQRPAATADVSCLFGPFPRRAFEIEINHGKYASLTAIPKVSIENALALE